MRREETIRRLSLAVLEDTSLLWGLVHTFRALLDLTVSGRSDALLLLGLFEDRLHELFDEDSGLGASHFLLRLLMRVTDQSCLESVQQVLGSLKSRLHARVVLINGRLHGER